MNIAMVYSELMDVGAPVTGVHPAEEMSDGGLEIDGRYLVQLSRYEKDSPIILSIIEDSGIISDGLSFKTIGGLIQFIMEN